MKLLASDYDGTLKYAQQIMQEDLDAIQRWRDAGNLFVINTGRSMESIKVQMEKYNISADYYITNHGGMVFDKDEFELFSSYLEYITSLDIIYIAKELEGVVSYVVNDGKHRHRIIVNDRLQEKRYMQLQPDMSEDEVLDLGKYAKITISMSETGAAIELANQLNTFFSDDITAYANNFVVEIGPKGITKATGMEFLCEFEDIDEYDTYAIGDSYSDIEMIEFSPNGACISTAPDDLKWVAKQQYDSIHEMIDEIMK